MLIKGAHILFVPPTPVNLAVLRRWLVHYTDKSAAAVLEQGFSQGFSLGFHGPRVSREADSLKSAQDMPNIVLRKLNIEIELGRIAGPFSSPPFPNLQCSPIGLVPKQQPGSFRLIHHLSYPSGDSVNDYISKDECKVHYASFDTAMDLAMSVGPQSWLAKADIKSAFRLLPVAPSDYELLGFKFQDRFYYDMCLPMGCRISCSHFEMFSTFLEFHIKRVSDTTAVTHYLDDFLFVGRSKQQCNALLTSFRSCCAQLRVPLAEEKTEGPCQVITFLGLEIDTVHREVRVPQRKVVALREKIQACLERRKLTLKEIQSLIGSLNFVCRAIAPGRAFTRRLISLTRGIKKPHHRVRISPGAKLDLLVWLEFLDHFNGVSAFRDQAWQDNDTLELFTDAAASIGFGGYFDGHWFQGEWTPELRAISPSIAYCEFYPLVIAVYCWGPRLANRKVRFHTDNESVVHIINKQSSNCDRIMHLVRLFVCQCLRYNVTFKAVHIPGVHNDIADSLSRFQVNRFRTLAPQADKTMTPIPDLLRA